MLGAVLNCTEMDAADVGAERRVGVKPGVPAWGPHVRFRRVQTLVREGSPFGQAVQFRLERLRPPPMTFPLGEAVEVQHDANVVAQ